MKHTVDVNKYNLRTDLIIEDNIKQNKLEKYDNIKVTKIKLNKKESSLINKKPGTYITIEFNDITDSLNKTKVEKVLIKYLKEIIKNRKDKSFLIVGLGNNKSTPDALGPKVIEKITVTRHLFLIDDVDFNYNCVSAFIPGVTGSTGIETQELIKNAVESVKPDYLIVIDALVSSSINRLNKTIQISDSGINPGSGIGNNRKEISKESLNIPVIAIGVPTVLEASTIIYEAVNIMKKDYKNLIVTPKDIDFQIEKLSDVIAYSINKMLKKN